ncbi:helix-turn-helix domain-containing protein [Actinomadura fibrosa]|uniref:Helix-turn-helix domain-containing protein n=1 Tax=Actinomadura fibrosa TaxID=111802 RepID=A0ABW2XQG8_9ACTN|nr:helix-turn-helix transcriptional regulator [Actinomadura fibrosa]
MAPQVPTVRQRRLGLELRRLRDANSLTVEQIASRLNWSASKLSRLENAKIGARVSDVRLLLELYGVDESHKGEILALAHAATQPGWWLDYRHDINKGLADYIAYEDEAESVRQYETQVIPGLLQSPGYARYVIASYSAVVPTSPAVVDRRVKARLRRQDVLRRASPLRLSVILDESVLLRRIGDATIMNEQLTRLAEWSRLPNITLRVMPLHVNRSPVMSESFTLMSFSTAYDAELYDVVILENISSSEFRDEDTSYFYQLAWEQLIRSTLDPDESRQLVLRTAQERWGELEADHHEPL